jgi:DNA-binding transcriptional regulator YhcF (GntR family)
MTHRRELFLPPLSLDASCGVPLHQQLRRQLEAAIRRGTPAGAALPSSRARAALLRVSRNTVLVFCGMHSTRIVPSKPWTPTVRESCW